MIFYRSEIHTGCENELQTIIEHAENRDSKSEFNFRRSLQVIMSPAFLRPYRCVGILFNLYNTSALPVLTIYTHTFLEVEECIIEPVHVFTNQPFPNSLFQIKQKLQ